MSKLNPTTLANRTRSWQLATVLCITAIAIGILVMLSANQKAEREAIARMPAKERQALYERTLHTLETSCARQPEGLDDFCREQAEFIVQFPECDAPCQAQAKLHQRNPTR